LIGNIKIYGSCLRFFFSGGLSLNKHIFFILHNYLQNGIF